LYSHKSFSIVDIPYKASITIGVKFVLAVGVHFIEPDRPGQMSLVIKAEIASSKRIVYRFCWWVFFVMSSYLENMH
jgi:hypothetical protein